MPVAAYIINPENIGILASEIASAVGSALEGSISIDTIEVNTQDLEDLITYQITRAETDVLVDVLARTSTTPTDITALVKVVNDIADVNCSTIPRVS